MSILTVRLSPAPLPIGPRICCVGFIEPIRDTCKHWRAWSREKFVEHLRPLYPQLSNAADKSYLEMIREIRLQYDLENPVVELKFQSELSKIVKHYDSLTISEEAYRRWCLNTL